MPSVHELVGKLKKRFLFSLSQSQNEVSPSAMAQEEIPDVRCEPVYHQSTNKC